MKSICLIAIFYIILNAHGQVRKPTILSYYNNADLKSENLSYEDLQEELQYCSEIISSDSKSAVGYQKRAKVQMRLDWRHSTKPWN